MPPKIEWSEAIASLITGFCSDSPTGKTAQSRRKQSEREKHQQIGAEILVSPHRPRPLLPRCGEAARLLGQQSAFTDKQAQRGEMRRYIRLTARGEQGGGAGADRRFKDSRAGGEEGKGRKRRGSQGEMKGLKEIQGKVDVGMNGCN